MMRSFNTIKDDIDLKLARVPACEKSRFNTIKDDIDLKPQIEIDLYKITIEK